MADYSFYKFRYRRRGRVLTCRSFKKILRPQEAKLLECFLLNPGATLSVKFLAKTLWPRRTVDFANGIRVVVAALRGHLNDYDKTTPIIENIPGQGYRFAVPVKVLTPLEGVSFLKFNSAPPSVNLGIVLALVFGMFSFFMGFLGQPPNENERNLTGLMSKSDLWEQENPLAFQAFLRVLEGDYNPEYKQKSFREIINQYPSFSSAHYELAKSLLLFSPAPAKDEIFSLLDRAIEINPFSANFYSLKARAYWMLEKNWSMAGVNFQYALDIGPQSIEARLQYARFLTIAGFPEKAIQEIDKAKILNPLETAGRSDVGWLYLLNRAFEKSYQACVDLEIIAGDSPKSLKCKIDLNLAQNNKDQAILAMGRYLEATQSLVPSDSILNLKDHEVEERFWISQLKINKNLNGRDSPAPVLRAIAHLRLGDEKSALEEIAIADANGNYFVAFVAIIPDFTGSGLFMEEFKNFSNA